MSQSTPSLDQILEAHIQTLALRLVRDTVSNYRCVARRFLHYLHTAFPRVRRPSQLRRDPHIIGWFRALCCTRRSEEHTFELQSLRHLVCRLLLEKKKKKKTLYQ